ncbi:HTH-type sugar sensing transcriptional regulator TrmBL1 [uncultured archaeon]|nr:HTH-type sugar sensing transcriptional regulator TrmBL1 [uncultured archaeon]
MVLEMEEKMSKFLELIGLNKNEIRIYLDLLKYRPSSALEVSRRTGIHRSNTYDALRKLMNIGFVSEVIKQKKRLFSAMPPENIKDYLTQQEGELETMLPYLTNLCKTEKEEEDEFSIAKGVFAVRESLNDLLKLNQPIYCYGVSTEAINAFGIGFLNEFHKTRIKKGILMRHIYDETAKDRAKKLNKMKLTEARCLPKKYETVASTNICDNTVLITVFSNPVSSIKIKNKELANAYTRYFEILWKQAKCV